MNFPVAFSTYPNHIVWLGIIVVVSMRMARLSAYRTLFGAVKMSSPNPGVEFPGDPSFLWVCLSPTPGRAITRLRVCGPTSSGPLRQTIRVGQGVSALYLFSSSGMGLIVFFLISPLFVWVFLSPCALIFALFFLVFEWH
jgi:hypothetical protein